MLRRVTASEKVVSGMFLGLLRYLQQRPESTYQSDFLGSRDFNYAR